MWEAQGRLPFKNIHVVKSPAHEAAAYLAQRFLDIQCETD
jgi:hypothetical protein